MSLPAEKQAIISRAEEMVGKTLAGRYRIDSVLGVGAMGVVYKTHHEGLRKDVALKLLHRELTQNEEIVARFDREAAAASRLDHPNCVRIMDFGSTPDGQTYLVMELLLGYDLSQLIEEDLDHDRVVGLVLQILQGLDHAHRQGLVHRDIKPENVFVTKKPEGELLKLLDYGIAKIQHGAGAGALTQAGMVFGTPQYMSPEQSTGKPIDARTDLYSTGIVMYALLTGRLPFDGDDPVRVLAKQIRTPPPALPDSVPLALRRYVERLLAKNPDERYASAAEAIKALKQASGAGEPARERTMNDTPTAALPDAPSTRPKWLIPAVVGGCALLLLAVLWPGGDEEVGGTDESAAVAEQSKSPWKGLLGGDDDEPEERPDKPDNPDESAEPTPADEPDPDAEGRALRASLSSIDALIASSKFEAAQITIAPLLEVYSNSAILHWRLGHVLTRLGGKQADLPAALESYRTSLSLDQTMLQDERFSKEFFGLLDDPKHRVRATEIAVELLEEEGMDRLIVWLNVQRTPMPYRSRHLAMAHLRSNERGAQINDPLQVSLDLWQAWQAAKPCEAFSEAMQAAHERPDSFLRGTLDAVPVPATGPDDEGPCQGAQERLDSLRTQYAQRYAGLSPAVPAAFQRKKKPTRRRRR